MSLPVFCSPKKWIVFFISFQNRERGWRFRLGTFATVCSALYRWDFNILIQDAPKSWKMLPLQGGYEGRKATMHIWIQWSCHILSTEIPSSDCFWRQHRCIFHCICESHYSAQAILWELRWRSMKVASASQFVYKCSFFLPFFLTFPLISRKKLIWWINICLVINKALSLLLYIIRLLCC